MKIWVDARPLSYQLTGIGIYLRCLLDEIQELDSKNYYCLISSAPINYEIRNPKWSKIESRVRGKLINPLWFQLVVPLIAARDKIDLFWGPRHQVPIFLPYRILTVLTVHDIVHRLYPETMAFPNLLSERLFFHLSLARSRMIIVDSRSTAFDIQRYYSIPPERVETIHPGTPPLPGLSGKDGIGFSLPSRYFLFVGTLDPRKNIESLLTAFEMVRPEKNGVHLLVVGGKGWKNSSFYKRIRSHPFKEYVHLTGYVPREYLKSLYENALCLLFPSLYEGFGFPILEAMSCGTPVITSNTSSMPEVAGNAALFVDPPDTVALAEAMQDIMKREGLRNELAAKGLVRAKTFLWRKSAEKTMEVFEKVLKQ